MRTVLSRDKKDLPAALPLILELRKWWQALVEFIKKTKFEILTCVVHRHFAIGDVRSGHAKEKSLPLTKDESILDTPTWQ